MKNFGGKIYINTINLEKKRERIDFNIEIYYINLKN